jgi:hypothetical protein
VSEVVASEEEETPRKRSVIDTPKVETASLDRGGHRRKVLIGDEAIRAAFGDTEVNRANRVKTLREWIIASVCSVTGKDYGGKESTEIEIR